MLCWNIWHREQSHRNCTKHCSSANWKSEMQNQHWTSWKGHQLPCKWKRSWKYLSIHAVWDLLHAATKFLLTLTRCCFPAHQIWLQTVQLGNFTSQDKSQSKSEQQIYELMFAHDFGIVTHAVGSKVFNRFSHAWNEFGLTLSIKNTTVMGQDVDKTHVLPSPVNPLSINRSQGWSRFS